MGDERIRLFCALQLPGAALDELAAWRDEVLPAAGRPVRRDDLHVTLAFLGARGADEVPVIGEALRAASAQVPPLELRPLRYRETRSVGMLVLEDAGGAAAGFAGDVQDRLAALGVYRREARAWLPHVTLVRRPTRAGDRPGVPNTCSIRVVRSALYRSSLGSGGATYDVLETAALGGR